MATKEKHAQFIKDWVSANFCDGEDRSEATGDSYPSNILENIEDAKDLMDALLEEFPELRTSSEYTMTLNGPQLYHMFAQLTPEGTE